MTRKWSANLHGQLFKKKLADQMKINFGNMSAFFNYVDLKLRIFNFYQQQIHKLNSLETI